jgi:hypothetical protein
MNELTERQLKKKEYNLTYYSSKKDKVNKNAGAKYRKKTFDAFIDKLLARPDIEDVMRALQNRDIQLSTQPSMA